MKKINELIKEIGGISIYCVIPIIFWIIFTNGSYESITALKVAVFIPFILLPFSFLIDWLERKNKTKDGLH